MEINFLTILLVLVGLAVVWTVLRAFLKLTARFFTLGCIAIFILAGGIWIISTVL
jgi:hypothetical protein